MSRQGEHGQTNRTTPAFSHTGHSTVVGHGGRGEPLAAADSERLLPAADSGEFPLTMFLCGSIELCEQLTRNLQVSSSDIF